MTSAELVAASWRRSALMGVRADAGLTGVPMRDVDLDSPLARAARPVLEEVSQTLASSGFAFVLADQNADILGWYGDTSLVRLLRNQGADIGCSLAESAAGTNGVGTAIELRGPVHLRHEDHYMEQLQTFTCLGQPIIHPLTHRVAGALDVTGTTDLSHPLLVSFMQQVVRDIETRLVDASKTAERELLAEFRTARRDRNRAVVAIGDDTVLANRLALDHLHGNDFAVLRSLAPKNGGPEIRTVPVSLSEGRGVVLSVRTLSTGTLMTFHPGQKDGIRDKAEESAGRSARRTPRSLEVGDTQPGVPETTLIIGPPGSGRTTRAREHAGTTPLKMVSAHLATGSDPQAWARAAHNALATTPQNQGVCLDDIDLVPDPLLAPVLEALRQPERPSVTLIMDGSRTLSPRAAALASLGAHRIVLAPLVERREDLHLLATQMLEQMHPGTHIRLTPTALEALAAHHWPGNLTELHSVLASSSAHRTSGDLALSDLPEAYRSLSPARHLGTLEQAESEAISRALEKTGGNKSQAAKILGISRTTLYSRIRQLRITG